MGVRKPKKDFTMKNLICFLLAGLLAITLNACGGENDSPSNTPSNTPSTPTTPTNPDPQPGSDTKTFVSGADISWVTEQEADGVKFFNTAGQERDCFALMKEIGMDAIRLRVWVNPVAYGYGAWCDKADVVKKALRAKNAGQDVMIDFHYSDFFADPGRQETPKEWQGLDLEQLKTKVAEHTKDVLGALKSAGVTPKWVQVGNETRNGMMWPTGQLWTDSGDTPNGWKNYVALTNAGFDAVKQVFSDAIVIIHLNNAWQDCDWWFAKYKELGGKMDMIGLSHYPQTEANKTWAQVNSEALAQIKLLINKYKVPVMMTEVGVKSADEAEAAKALTAFLTEAKKIEQCVGAFYWEPQVYGGWIPSYYKTVGWGSYDQGAFTSDGKPAKCLDAFK